MRRLFAAILALVVVVPLLLAALGSFAISSWAMNPGFYVSVLSDERLYELALEQWRAHAGAPLVVPPVPGLSNVPPEALGEALREVLTPGYLRSQAMSLVKQAFGALEGQTADALEGKLQLQLDLAPLKQTLRGEAGTRFARRLAERLPVCPGSSALPGGAGLPSCRPEGLSTERFSQLIASRLPAVLDSLPDTYALPADTLGWHPHRTVAPWQGFLGTHRLLWASVILAVIAAGFWIGAAFLASAERREILLWLGCMLALPAALTLLAGLGIRLAWFGSGPWLFRRLPHWLDGTTAASRRMIQMAAEVARPILATIGRGFLLAGGVAAGIAAGLIIWSVSAPRAPGD